MQYNAQLRVLIVITDWKLDNRNKGLTSVAIEYIF